MAREVDRARQDRLFNITHGLARRVPLIKLVKLDGDVHPYLDMLMVATLAWVGVKPGSCQRACKLRQ